MWPENTGNTVSSQVYFPLQKLMTCVDWQLDISSGVKDHS
jgi:hypothetical protein